MKRLKRLTKIIFEFLIFTLIMGFVITRFMGTTYAVMSAGEPNVVVTIDKSGNISYEGNLFGNGLWYPDEKGRDGIIRIYNNYKSTKLTSLGVGAALDQFKKEYMEAEVYNSFLEHMKLTVKKGRWLQFGDTSIISDKSLADLLYTAETGDNYDGIVLDKKDQINISAGNPVDLKYTLRMDENAGNELESLIADVSFMIKTPLDGGSGGGGEPGDNEKPGGPGGGGGGTPGGSGTPASPGAPVGPAVEHWAHDCIITLVEKGIVKGYDDGEIKPDAYITRAEAAVLVGRALKLEPKDTLIPKYIDSIPKWADGYINITTEEDIFRGYPFRRFKPNNNITREEMIAVLTRAFDLSLDDNGLELPFTDKEDIAAWALENVKSGYEDKVIEGYPDNSYKPQNNITRAEAFTIICKLLNYHETHLYKVQ